MSTFDIALHDNMTVFLGPANEQYDASRVRRSQLHIMVLNFEGALMFICDNRTVFLEPANKKHGL